MWAALATAMSAIVIILLNIPSLRSLVGGVPRVSAGTSYYVATNGSSSGDGSSSKPWDLQTALKHPAKVKPGDTIWVKGGTYKGNFTSSLKGGTNAPITVRAVVGERVTLDGKIESEPVLKLADAFWVNFWGLELTHSNTVRSIKTDSSGGAKPGSGEGFRIAGTTHHLKFINMIIHDNSGMGGAWWIDDSDSELYGSLIYFNGVNQLDHGVYTQNQNGSKRLVDNIIFANASHGIHAYGSSKTYLNNYYVEGNISFINGIIGYNTSKKTWGHQNRNILVGGGVVAQNPTVIGNYTYFPKTSGQGLNVGYSAGSKNPKILDNYIMGGGFESGTPVSGLTMTGNTFFVSSVTGTSKTSANTWLSAKPTGVKVVVRPNKYEAGRANIAIYNWDKKSTVSISSSQLSGVGLNNGDTYELRNVLNYFGDVLTGTYNGSSITVPMTGRSVARPVGLSFTPETTFPEFGAFVLLKKGGGTATVAPTRVPTVTIQPTRVPQVTITPVPTSSVPATKVIIYPSGDTYVRAANSSTNYGNLEFMSVDSAPDPKEIAYMKFSTANLAGKRLVSAKLNLYALDASVGPLDVHPTSASWSESAMNYQNRPALGDQITTFKIPAANVRVSVDVTSYVQGKLGQMIGFAIDTESGDGTKIATIESDHNPQLIIEYR